VGQFQVAGSSPTRVSFKPPLTTALVLAAISGFRPHDEGSIAAPFRLGRHAATFRREPAVPQSGSPGERG